MSTIKPKTTTGIIDLEPPHNAVNRSDAEAEVLAMFSPHVFTQQNKDKIPSIQRNELIKI